MNKCHHLNPSGYIEPNTEKKMSRLAKRWQWFSVNWGVVNRGNARCAAVFHTKKEATEWKRRYACGYVVVKVAVTPAYNGEYNDPRYHG